MPGHVMLQPSTPDPDVCWWRLRRRLRFDFVARRCIQALVLHSEIDEGLEVFQQALQVGPARLTMLYAHGTLRYVESEPPMRRSAGPTRTSIMRSRTPTRRSQARRSHAHVLVLKRPSDSHGGAAACTQSTEDKIALRSLLLKSPPFRSFAFPECEDR